MFNKVRLMYNNEENIATTKKLKRQKGDIRYYWMMEQGSEEWLRARLGIVTASEVNKLITPKGKIAKNETVRAYARALAGQRILSQLEDNYQSFDMVRGHLQEETARKYYHDNYDQVTQCGFVTRQFDGFKIGASPDGIVYKDGGIEIKSRLAKFQIETICADEVPSEYINQIQTSMLVTGREWWDFVQYSNGLPLFVKRVLPDAERQDLIKEAVRGVEDMVCDYMTKFNELASKMVPTEWVEYCAFEDLVTVGGE